MTRKNKRKLGIKLLLALSILAIVVTVASIITGSYLYKKNVIARYTEWAFSIGEAAENMFTTEEIAYYSDVLKQYRKGEVSLEEVKSLIYTERYQEELSKLKGLREGMGANDILFFYLDPDDLVNYNLEEVMQREIKPMMYIWDSYYDEAGQVYIGDSWGFVPDKVPDIEYAVRNGVRVPGDSVSEGSYGYTVTATRPIVYNGESIACVLVEAPMSTLISEMREFYTLVSIVAILVALILLGLISVVSVKTVINPIVLVADEADSFITNDNVVSEKLSNVKTGDEIQTLSESILAMEIGINEYIDNLTKATAERERISAELSVATKIQLSALPNVFPPFPGRNEFDLYATMKPAKEVGGDFYDFYLVDEDHLALTIADVSGKGVPAALFMMISKLLLKSHTTLSMSPAEVLSSVNNQLIENNDAEMFVTVWLGILEISTGKMIAASAGHEYPAIMRANGQFEIFKDRHGMVLGGMEDIRYKEYELDFEKGDTLFVYTDGVAEATDSNNVLFGNDRLIDALNIKPDGTPHELIDNVYDQIVKFVDVAPQFDDITMLCMHYNGKQE